MSSESSKALKALASAIKTMTDPSTANFHVENSKTAINDLKIALKDTSVETPADLQAILPIASVASTIIEITRCVEKISESVHELSSLAHFQSFEPTVSPEKPHGLLHRGSIKPVLGSGGEHVVITVHPTSTHSLENKIPETPKAGQRLDM